MSVGFFTENQGRYLEQARDRETRLLLHGLVCPNRVIKISSIDIQGILDDTGRKEVARILKGYLFCQECNQVL